VKVFTGGKYSIRRFKRRVGKFRDSRSRNRYYKKQAWEYPLSCLIEQL